VCPNPAYSAGTSDYRPRPRLARIRRERELWRACHTISGYSLIGTRSAVLSKNEKSY